MWITKAKLRAGVWNAAGASRLDPRPLHVRVGVWNDAPGFPRIRAGIRPRQFRASRKPFCDVAAVTVKKGFLLIIQKIVPIPANIRLATSATIVLSIVTVTLRKMCNVTFVAQREGIEQM